MRCFRASEDCQHIGINTTISKTGLNADYPVIQNKNLGTASQTLLTEVKLHLWHRLPFFMPGSSFWRCDIHDFHNGGPRAKPGSSGVKTRPEWPASRRVSCCLQHKLSTATSSENGESIGQFKWFKCDSSYGKRYSRRFSTWTKT